MKITVEYYAALREAAGVTREELQTDAATPLALYRELQQRHSFKLEAAKLLVAINDTQQMPYTALSDGDLVVFIPPVSGG